MSFRILSLAFFPSASATFWKAEWFYLFIYFYFDKLTADFFAAALEKPTCKADLMDRTPAGSSTCSRWGSAVKWSPDEADKPLVDAGWCVSVDFNVGFLTFGDVNAPASRWESRALAGNHGARGVVWQLMWASVAAWRTWKRLYGSQRWWWMCSKLWGNITKILPVWCVFGWTLVERHILSVFQEKHDRRH